MAYVRVRRRNILLSLTKSSVEAGSLNVQLCELLFLEIALLARLQIHNQSGLKSLVLALAFLASHLKDLPGACSQSREFSTVLSHHMTLPVCICVRVCVPECAVWYVGLSARNVLQQNCLYLQTGCD